MYGSTSIMRNIYPEWLYGHKCEIFYCAFSFLGRGLYVRCSNLANYRFTLVPLLQDSKPEKRKAAKEDRTHHQLQSARGAAKKAIEIDH